MFDTLLIFCKRMEEQIESFIWLWNLTCSYIFIETKSLKIYKIIPFGQELRDRSRTWNKKIIETLNAGYNPKLNETIKSL